MSTVADKLLSMVSEEHHVGSSKITLVGIGQVGMAAAFSLMVRGVISELALVDVAADKLKGEMMDLQHGQAFLHNVKIQASTDYAISKGSKICVVTAGARQVVGESRLNLVQRNVEIFKHIIPNLMKHNPDTILLIVSNPVDILTYVAWKMSGLPRHRVIGSGTMLDSSRFRFEISQRLNVSPSSVHGYIIGEHGDSSVALWSSVNIAGTKLQEALPNIGQTSDPENWEEVHKNVIAGAYEVIRLKGYTSWAIGLMVSTLCQAILRNQKTIYCLSTNVKGCHGIEEEVYLSLPVVVSEAGVLAVLNQNLDKTETAKLQESAKAIREVIDGINM